MTRLERVKVDRRCAAFIDGLLEIKLLCNPDVFSRLDTVARRRGYTIAAHQRGIQGTYICFEPLDGWGNPLVCTHPKHGKNRICPGCGGRSP
jgi:hypothetical protein